MRMVLARMGGFVAGSAFGGLLVGLAEGLYRDAGALYASLLYGTLWSLLGTALGVLLAVLLRERAQRIQLRWGLVAALAPSALVLVRFIVLRDLMQEATSAAWVALAAGLVAAAAIIVVALKIAMALRRRFVTEQLGGSALWLVPLAVVVAFTVRAQAGDDELPSRLPNPTPLKGRGVVLVVIDALRADALGAYGAPAHRGEPATPNLDELAKQSLVFTDVSAQASWTKPAMASLMTSRHVSAHATMSKPAMLPGSLPTLASAVSGAHVATAAVVTNYNLEQGYGFDHGFERFEYLPPARYLGAPPRANRLAAYNVYRLLRERFLKHSREARHFYRPATTVNARGLAMLDEVGNNDFFLYLHYMEPHDPYFSVEGPSWAKVSDPNPPATWAPKMQAAYRDEVRRADAAVGDLWRALVARGLGDRVTLIVTADHGEEFAEHGGFYHGTTLYEEQLHVPLLIHGPDVAPGMNTTLARQIDIAPTVIARLGRKAPDSFEGRDLLGTTPPATMTLAEEDHEGNVLASLRSGTRKLILANPDNPRGLKPAELYDLAKDPNEKQSTHADSAAVETLTTTLRAAQSLAQKGGASTATRPLDAAAEAELRSLGYMK